MSTSYENAVVHHPASAGRPITHGAPIGLVRERLVLQLDLLDARLVGLVVAPAGSGKSTLIRQFAALRASSSNTYQLGPADVRPGSFLIGLHRACIPADAVPPGLSATSYPPGSDETLAEEIVAELTRRSVDTDTLLIVDDLQVIEDTPALGVFSEILAALPRRVRALIGSRCVPGIDLTRLRLDEDIIEIGADDLRFRSWEIEALFAQQYATWLPPRELSRLARATDGWAAGLKLFHLATGDRTDAERNVELDRLCASRSHTVRDYLTRNVVSTLPAETREFLVRTSVLGHLTPATCDALLSHHVRTGGPGVSATVSSRSRLMLDELDRRQLFMESRDNGYRYHEVLRGHLEALLAEELGAEDLRAWYGVAALILEEHHAPGDAVRAYVCAGDVDGALRNLGEAGALVGREAGWIERLPVGLVDHDPWIGLVQARRLVTEGHPEPALHAYQTLVNTAIATDAGQIASREMQELRRWIEPDEQPPDPLSWLSLLRSALRRNPDGARLACARIPGAESLATVGLIALLDGNFPAALAAFNDAKSSGTLGEIVSGARALTNWFASGRDPVNVLVRIRDRADHDANVWMARVTRAVLLAFPLPSDESFETEFSSIAKPALEAGDHWSPAVGKLFGGLGYALAADSLLTRDEAITILGEATTEFAALGAEVLAAWAQMTRISLEFDDWVPCDGEARERRPGIAPSVLDHALATVERAAATLPCTLVWRAADIVGGRSPATDVPGGLHDWIRLSTVGPAARPAARPSVITAAGQPPRATRPGSGSGLSQRHTARLFGAFQLTLGGDTIDCRPLKPRARSVLRMLVLRSGQWVHRDELLDALWPAAPTTSSVNSLHVCLSAIRHALGGHAELLRREGEAYRFERIDDHDLHRFADDMNRAETARRSGDLDAALAIISAAVAHGPDVLPDEGSPDWLVVERSALTGLVARTCSSIATDALSGKHYAGAVQAAELGLATDAYNDGLWKCLREALERAGRVAEAARVQHRYEEMLNDLGLLPVFSDVPTSLAANRVGETSTVDAP